MGKKKDLVEEWQGIYSKYLGYGRTPFYFDFNLIPDYYSPQQHFAVLIKSGLDLKQIIDAVQSVFNVSFNNFSNQPFDPEKIHDYARAYKDCCALFPNERDNIYGARTYYSYNNRHDMRRQSINLKEHLLLQLYYYEYYKESLDQNGATICIGSDWRFYEQNGTAGSISVSYNNFHDQLNINYCDLPGEGEETIEVYTRKRLYYSL